MKSIEWPHASRYGWLLATLFGGSAAATEPALPPAPAATTTLDSITVSARRRDEALSKVPAAVTALSAEALDHLHVRDLGDLDALVPNLTAYAARGSNSTITAYLRGIGQSDPLWGVDPGVGIYLDDVYIARPQGALLAVYDIDRIEVLRGPQGTLFGKNTIGGAIRYIPAAFEPEAYGQAELDIGSHEQLDITTSINLPLAGGAWASRVALASLSRDGYGHNLLSGQPVSDQEVLAARVSLGTVGEQAYFLRLNADLVDDRSGARGAQLLAANPFAAEHPPLASRYDVRSGLGNVNDTRTRGVSAVAGYHVADAWTFKWTAALRDSETTSFIDFDLTPERVLDSKAYYADQQHSEELQLSYDDDRLKAVFGLFAFDGYARGRVLGNFFDRIFNSTEGQVDTTSVALYGDLTYPLAARWNASFGLRATRESKHARVFNYGFNDGSFSTPNGSASADFSDSARFQSLAPRLAVDFSLSPDLLLYGLISQGDKSGGFNIRANTAAVPESARPFADESLLSTELGLKYATARLQLNLALFHNDYRDIQLSVNSAYDSDGDGIDDAFFGDFTNAGRGHADGIELEWQWALGPHWRWSGQLGYLHTGYDDYQDRGINVAASRRFTNAPEWSAAQIFEYLQGDWRTRLTISGQSEVYPTTDLSEAIRQGGYGLLGLGVYWSPPGIWKYALELDNLGDRHYRTTGYNLATFGVLTGYYGAPRTVTFSLSAAW